jgi:TCP-1/cpn60 chaperonin family
MFGCVDSLFRLLFGTRICKVSCIVLWQLSIGEALACLTAGSHVLDEAERSLHDALCVLNAATADSRVLYGGGWPEMQMAKVGSQPGSSARFLPVPDCTPAAAAPMRLPHAMSCHALIAEITLTHRLWMRRPHARQASAASRWRHLHARCGPSPRSSPTMQVPHSRSVGCVGLSTTASYPRDTIPPA